MQAKNERHFLSFLQQLPQGLKDSTISNAFLFFHEKLIQKVRGKIKIIYFSSTHQRVKQSFLLCIESFHLFSFCSFFLEHRYIYHKAILK